MAATIESKPAAGLVGGALTTVALGLAARHTGYEPSVEEVAGITTLAAFAVAWLVPSQAWRRMGYRADNVEIDGLAVDPHEGGR